MKDKVARSGLVDLARILGLAINDNGTVVHGARNDGESIPTRVLALEDKVRRLQPAAVSLRTEHAEMARTDGCGSAPEFRPTSVEEVNAKMEALAAHLGLRFVPYQVGGITRRSSEDEHAFVVAPIPLHPDVAVAKALEELGLTEASRNGVVGKVAWRVVDLILGRASAAAPAS